MSGKFTRNLRYDLPLHFVLLITNWLPDNILFLRLRGWLASFFFGSCGKNLILGRNIVFYNPSEIFIGGHVYIAYGCWFNGTGQIKIEDEVQFGPYCVIVASDHSSSEGSFRYAAPILKTIKIGKGAWIGAHVTITAGVNIGKGSAIAAAAVVTHDVSDGCLAGGVPAKIIKVFEKSK